MLPKKGLLMLAAPLAAILLLVAAVAARRERPVPGPVPIARPAPAAEATAPLPDAAPPPPKRRARVAPPSTVRISDEARLRTVYQSYRTAVATGDDLLRDTLHETLTRERPAALWLAQEDVESAEEDGQRDLARKTLESLRR